MGLNITTSLVLLVHFNTLGGLEDEKWPHKSPLLLQVLLHYHNPLHYQFSVWMYRIAKNFGELGEPNSIHQYFTQPNSRVTTVANVCYCKFAKNFPHQNSEMINSPNFYSSITVLNTNISQMRLVRKTRKVETT